MSNDKEKVLTEMAAHGCENQEHPQIGAELPKDGVLSESAVRLYEHIKADVQNRLLQGTALLGEGFFTAEVVLFTDEEN